jgi:hypothetical protein
VRRASVPTQMPFFLALFCSPVATLSQQNRRLAPNRREHRGMVTYCSTNTNCARANNHERPRTDVQGLAPFLRSQTRGRPFGPTCRPRSLTSAKKGTMALPSGHEPGARERTEKDRPIDPMPGRNASARKSPIRLEPLASGRAPALHASGVSHNPRLQTYPFSSPMQGWCGRFSSGALRTPFNQR